MKSKFTAAFALRSMFAFVLMAAFVPSTLVAQEARGKITGRVVDPTRGILPGATVKVTDVQRNTTVTTVTNAEGLFQVNYLLSSTYFVTIEMPGFKKYVKDQILLEIGETRDLPITLQMGGAEETVLVTADAATINTTDANMGLTVDARRIAELPLIHGDPYKIMGLATGVTHSGSQRLDRPYEPTHIVGYAYDGTRGNRSDLLIDGAPSTATANANEVIATYVPPSDLVQEFRVQTATFDAQFGNTEGGVTSISIKSGTNKLKGSVYYFFEPVTLAANDFFGKARGQQRVDSSSTRPGFTVTGPVRIPGMYDGRERTFFTVGFERIKDVRPRFDAGANVWVPTEALRNGDFSAYSSNITIYDPATRVPGATAGQFVGQPFPGNIIPQNRISPVAKAILSYYSLPKNPGLVGNIFDSTLPETADYNSTTFRFDQKVANNNRMFVRGSWYKRDSHYNDYLGNGATSTNFQFISYQAVVDDVHTLNASTVLNVRYGFNRFERNSGQEQEYVANFDQTKLGFPSSYNNLVPDANRGFPRLEFPNMIGTAFGNDFRPVTSHTVSTTMNKSMGAHSAKGGVEMRIYREDSLPTGNSRGGRYVFNNTYTRQNSASGTDFEGLQGYASFLLGLPSTTEISRLSDYSEYSKTWGFFVHDDWRVNSKLTVNLGLRYELETPLVERNNKSVTGFDFAYTQPIEGTVQTRYSALSDPALKALVPQLNVKGGLMFAGVDGGDGLYSTPRSTFLPRVGFAYNVDSKTVIRGGAGLFGGFLGERRGDVIQPGYSQTTTIGTTTNAFGATIPRDIQTALLSTPILEPIGNTNGRQTSLGNAISFFNQNPKVSKQLRYQLGFQRELPGGWTLDAAYVGNYGYDIEISRNINTLPAQYLNADNSRSAAQIAANTFLTAAVANPFAGLVPGAGINNATVARSQLLRPHPGYGDITTTNNDGKSWYNSGQIGLQRRFSKGYTLGVSYTLSKWMQATEYLNASDPQPTKMISDLDATNRVAISGIFALPFGKGRKFMSDASGLTEALLGGWQIQGVYTYQTGFPVAFTTDLFYNGGDIALPSDQRSTLKWFNTGAFTSILTDTATNATPINHQRTLPLRFTEVRRDSINNIDLSLLKNVKLKGDMELQLRAEFVNAFNSAYLPGPVVNPTSATFGQVTASNQENYARRAQIGIKVLF